MGSGTKQTTTTKNKTDINSITPGLQPLLDSLVQKASWISNGGQKVLNPATGQMEDQINPFTTPAAATGDQLKAYEGIRGMQGSYDDIIAQALGLQKDAMTRAGRAPTQEDINPYKNLYLDNVLGDTVRAMQENSDRNMRDIGALGARTNSFGGSRQALLEGQNLYNTTRGIGEETNKINADSFTSALGNYLNSIGLRSQTSQAGMDRVGQAQSTRLKELAALENIGMSQQELAQKGIDKNSEEWLRLQDLPYKQLGALATASGAFPYQALDNTQTSVTKVSQNPLNQILGALTTGAGLLTGGAAPAAAGGLGGLFKGIWKEGGYVKPRGYAYGGRVGNPFTQSYSSEVIGNTQNPYSGMDTNVDTGATMAKINNGSGSSSLPGQNEMGNPLVDAQTPLLSSPGPSMVNMSQPVSPDLLMPQNTGGNPVAQLLGMFRNGGAQNGMASGIGLDGRPVQGFPTNEGVARFAAGGKVGTNPPIDLSAMLGGSKKPVGGTSASGTGIMDMITSKEGLIELGLRMMASDGNPLQALATSVLGMQEDRKQTVGDPMKQYMDMLKIQQLEDKIGYAGEDQDLQRQMQEARMEQIAASMSNMGADNARGLASLGLQYDEAAARQARWEAEQEYKRTRDAAEDSKPGKGPKYDDPGFNERIKTADDILLGKDFGEDYPGGVPLDTIIPGLESDVSAAQAIGDEQAARAALERAKKLKDRKAARDILARTPIPSFN